MSGQQKPKLDILIVIMQQNQSKLNYIKLTVQQNLQLQQLNQYLKTQNKVPFKNCIFTTKPAQKGQYTMQKTIKQLSNQCKVKNGAFILLCYQSQYNSPEENVSEMSEVKKTQKSEDIKKDKKIETTSIVLKNSKSKEDSGCILY